jgi:hypothetical protein
MPLLHLLFPDTEAVIPNWSSGGTGTWHRKQRKEVETS